MNRAKSKTPSLTRSCQADHCFSRFPTAPSRVEFSIKQLVTGADVYDTGPRNIRESVSNDQNYFWMTLQSVDVRCGETVTEEDTTGWVYLANSTDRQPVSSIFPLF